MAIYMCCASRACIVSVSRETTDERGDYSITSHVAAAPHAPLLTLSPCQFGLRLPAPHLDLDTGHPAIPAPNFTHSVHWWLMAFWLWLFTYQWIRLIRFTDVSPMCRARRERHRLWGGWNLSPITITYHRSCCVLRLGLRKFRLRLV
eukprot:scaffold32285_cov130-Isochrysis_galbana.AAC.6